VHPTSSYHTNPPRVSPSAVLDHRFDIIVSKINQQKECNAHFDSRITNLEATTHSIDQKIDRLLDHFDSSFPSSKIQKTSINSARDTMHHPGRASSLQSAQDSTHHV